jgi:hypothetical protein
MSRSPKRAVLCHKRPGGAPRSAGQAQAAGFAPASTPAESQGARPQANTQRRKAERRRVELGPTDAGIARRARRGLTC